MDPNLNFSKLIFCSTSVEGPHASNSRITVTLKTSLTQNSASLRGVDLRFNLLQCNFIESSISGISSCAVRLGAPPHVRRVLNVFKIDFTRMYELRKDVICASATNKIYSIVITRALLHERLRNRIIIPTSVGYRHRDILESTT